MILFLLKSFFWFPLHSEQNPNPFLLGQPLALACTGHILIASLLFPEHSSFQLLVQQPMTVSRGGTEECLSHLASPTTYHSSFLSHTSPRPSQDWDLLQKDSFLSRMANISPFSYFVLFVSILLSKMLRICPAKDSSS